MKFVVKPLSYVAMAITFTLSTLALAETTAPVKPTSDVASAPVTQPVVHHKKNQVKSDAKAAEVVSPVVADKAAVSAPVATDKVVASIPAAKPVEPVKAK